jgi:hypothetical protein
MNLEIAKSVLLRTHTSALALGERPNGYLMTSAPGIGKTEAAFQQAEALCVQINQPVGLVHFMLATITSPDVRGFGIPTKAQPGETVPGFIFSRPPWFPVQGNTWVVEPPKRAGDPCTWYRPGTWDEDIPEVGVLFLDEWGQAEDDVKKPAAELLLNGNVGTCELPRGWRVVAASNRVSDRSGVMRELVFTINRRGLMVIDPHMPTWRAWAERQSDRTRPHFMTISFAIKHPEVVFRDTVPEGYDPFCTPRSLCKMDRDLRAIRSDEEIAHDRMPTDDVAREVAAGWIGSGTAGQYFVHLKYHDELPDIEDIEDDPRSAKLPSGKDAQMVCSYMLAHSLKEENAQPVMRYILRMVPEMQIMAVNIIGNDIKRAKAMVAVPEWSRFLTENHDILKASRE